MHQEECRDNNSMRNAPPSFGTKGGGAYALGKNVGL